MRRFARAGAALPSAPVHPLPLTLDGRARKAADGPAVQRRAREAAPSRRVFLFVLFTIAQAIFLTSDLFRLQCVEVRGNVRLSDGVVKAEAALPMHAHFLVLPLREATERVRRLHWVEAASVRRALPGRAVIQIQEKTPILAVSSHPSPFPHGWFVMSADGTVLAPAGARGDARLPRVVVKRSLLVGSRLDARLVAAVQRYRADMPPGLAGEVREMRADANGQIDLMVAIVNRPVEARMGGPERTRYKFQVLQALVDVLQRAGRPVAYIDLRYPDPTVGHLQPSPGNGSNPAGVPSKGRSPRPVQN